MSKWFETWRVFGVTLLILLAGAVYLAAEGFISLKWQSIKAFAWGAAFVYLSLGVLTAYQLRSAKSPVRDNSPNENQPTEKNNSDEIIDPWPFARLCKEGKISYERAIKLCELQIEDGDEQSAAFLGWLYERGPVEIRDDTKSYAMYRLSALRGNEAALKKVIALERLDAMMGVMNEEQKAAWTANIARKMGLDGSPSPSSAPDPLSRGA